MIARPVLALVAAALLGCSGSGGPPSPAPAVDAAAPDVAAMDAPPPPPADAVPPTPDAAPPDGAPPDAVAADAPTPSSAYCGLPIPQTGTVVPAMARYDQVMTMLLRQHCIPGGAVAVVKDGRLVFARGYGLANIDQMAPVAPDALFRIASLSKPITAVAVLRLLERGQISLDARAFALLPDLMPPAGTMVADARLPEITVRQLLWHAGGWDRARSFDPMFRTGPISQALGIPSPPDAEAIIRYMFGQPLDFAPGGGYAYSNYGYNVLGRIIERVSRQSYAAFVDAEVLRPLGIKRMRIGRTRLAEAAPGEVRYYDRQVALSVFPGEPRTVAFPYGGFFLDAMDSHGGWVASTVDMLRFLTGVDGLATQPDLLRAETIALMTSRPPPPIASATSAAYYAMGWSVRPGPGNWWHNGSLPGTATIMVRAGNGTAWAAFFNARDTNGVGLEAAFDAALWTAHDGVTAWPSHDLFSTFD